MRRRAVVPSATATSGQPLPYLPLPMARTGVPADEGRTALPIFQTGTRRQGVLCGSAPTLYSSQVQQQARIPAHYGEPLRTNERLLTCASAAVRVNLPVSGGQGVAGSNPAVPTEYLQVSEVLRRFPSRLADLREPTGEPMELWFPAGRGYADGVALALRIRFMAVAPLVSAGLIS
jgi:hypothetical protein